MSASAFSGSAGTARARRLAATARPPTTEINGETAPLIPQDEPTTPFTHPKARSTIEQVLESEPVSLAVMATLTALAFAVRFYKINNPDQVVFDEVHFGKFAGHYLKREYYFDVHPPFAKLLFGLAGWFVGFDGGFTFENIGDSYTDNHVPYVGMRALPAILGSLTIPVMYAIMKETGYSTIIAAFSACLVLFDNGHIAQSRLILLDATLIFFMSLTIYSYIRFRKLRYWEFSPGWWGWLVATGVFMACTWASKVNGILTVATIGVAVLIDLWDLLDIKKGHSMEHFGKHFAARAVSLILIPLIVYMSFFWIHFAILTHSGPGDSFMSPSFQETLLGNEMLMNSMEIRYFDVITIKHRDSKVFLHSHEEKYPLRYDDGRISSQGQQVTGYGHNDTNNFWQVVPTKALPETGRGRIVRNKDVVQLVHLSTNTALLSHDVASSLMATNQEFTTMDRMNEQRFNDTLFEIVLADGDNEATWKTKSGHFRLIHWPTRVAMWTHNKPLLPDWAFKQQEINGNKNSNDKTAIWYVDEIVQDERGMQPHDRGNNEAKKEPKRLSFLWKFAELQSLMLQHNAGLTASHPYASAPLNWPFLLSGISFWTEGEAQKQIYMIGNIVSWWTCVVALSIYVGIVGADILARRRELYPLTDDVRNRLWNSGGFFLLVWGVHYFPFFLMSRQLFIHHYLPSHLASSLIAGSVLSFVLSETINYPISIRGPSMRSKPRPATYSDLGIKGPVVVGVFSLFLIGMFMYMGPLTYGTPGLDGHQVNAHRLLSSWTLHFAAKEGE